MYVKSSEFIMSSKSMAYGFILLVRQLAPLLSYLRAPVVAHTTKPARLATYIAYACLTFKCIHQILLVLILLLLTLLLYSWRPTYT